MRPPVAASIEYHCRRQAPKRESSMVETKGRRGGRAARRALRAAPIPEEERPVRPGLEGGRYKPLSDADVGRIHDAALDVLETIGLSQAIPSCVDLLTGAGGRIDEHGRVLLPRSLVEDTVEEVDVTYRRRPGGRSKISGTVTGVARAGTKIIWTIARLWLDRAAIRTGRPGT